MKNEIKKSLMIASLLISMGLFSALFVFFLLFGKGLQILMPGILFVLFFAIFFIFDKIPFTAKHPFLKAVLCIFSVVIVIFLI